MRILYLAQHQPFSGDHAGFAHVYNITRHLAEQGHEVVLAVKPPADGALPVPPVKGLKVKYVSWELEYPLPFGPFARLGPQLNIMEPARALRWVKRAVRDERVQVIQERHEMRLDLSPLSTRFLNVPSVLEVNSPFIEESFPEGSLSFRSRNFFRRLGFDGASAIIVQTELLKKMILRHTRTPIHVIPNGADPRLFDPEVPAPGLARKLRLGKLTVGFAGAFHPWHGALDLVEAFSRIAPDLPQAKLLMIGSGGEDLERCRLAASEKGLSGRAVFAGAVSYTELPRYLKLCDVLVAPFSPSKDLRRRAVFSRWGLWWCPLKVFEYMSMARPVVSSEVGVIPDYVQGAGLLYPEGDVGALAERLRTLLLDGALRARLGAAGRKKVETRFNWSEVARETVKVYESVLAGKG